MQRLGGVMKRLLIALVLATLPLAGAAADSGKDRAGGRKRSADVAVERAISEVNKRYQGRVLSAQPIDGGTRVRVKFLSKDGVIKTLVVDPGEG